MGKRIALKDFIEVDGVNISNFCRAVEFTSEHEEVDVSGFNATGANESLAGQTVQSVTLEVYGSYASGEIHQTLYPIHRDRDIVAFAWRPDGSVAASATNPELNGNVQVLSWGAGATRGEAETFSITLTAADENGLVFTNT